MIYNNAKGCKLCTLYNHVSEHSTLCTLARPTFSLQLLNMDITDRQILCTLRAGDQSSVSIERQMWPLL